MKIKPQNPKGVRDFLPIENKKREYIISVIKKHYELFGFESIYTPAFERLETLQGKYGDEGDKLLFKILNSGEYITNEAQKNILSEQIQYGELTRTLSSKGLRYDLTVPLARLVSQHQNDITFPFKRYHIAPVWRADRPQRGRYQEFFQCDADIVGTKSLLADIDLINLIQNVFEELDLKVEIILNNRKIFNGICLDAGIVEQSLKVSTILDKWDKIGEEKVQEELKQLVGIDSTNKLLKLISIQNYEELEDTNDQIKLGKEEVRFIFQKTDAINLKFDLKLLRGLDYYTGTVLEVVSTEISMGSLLGGGRYDNLTELFGLNNISGIGISFGLDRIYDAMVELEKFTDMKREKKALVLYLYEESLPEYFKILKTLRNSGINADIYPSYSKIDKQLIYADKCNYSHAIIVGEAEHQSGQILIKRLETREQITINNLQELVANI